MANLADSLDRIVQHRANAWVHGNGISVSVGMETHTDPSKYSWYGLRRGGDADHPSVLFQYTLHGWGTYADSAVQKVGRGQAFVAVIPSDHRYHLPAESPSWTFLWIMLHHPYIASRVIERQKRFAAVLDVTEDGGLMLASTRLFEGVCRESFRDDFALESACFDWLLEYERLAHGVLYPQSIRQKLLDQTREHVLRHITDTIAVEQLARQHGMSRSHYGHHFKAVTGLAPAQYIAQVRLEEASRLLTESDAKLDRIARQTGFADANHFCKVFRRFFHTSPARFRKQMSKR